jgi:hypothetical protein
MDSEYGPPRPNWSTWSWYGSPRRFGPGPDPSVRVGDTERSQMSDLLSKHYAEGRLDESEFRQRLDKAMGAKTRGDLNGLLADLPPLVPEASHQHRRPGLTRRVIWGMTVFTFVFFAIAIASAFATPHIPWVLFVVVFFVLMARGGRWHHHHHHAPASSDY